MLTEVGVLTKVGGLTEIGVSTLIGVLTEVGVLTKVGVLTMAGVSTLIEVLMVCTEFSSVWIILSPSARLILVSLSFSGSPGILIKPFSKESFSAP